MDSLREIAISAIRSLADEMIDHGEFPANWKTIDRIEKRFKLQGSADHYIQRWKASKARHEDTVLAKRLKENPDNAFHLHPPERLSYLSRLAA